MFVVLLFSLLRSLWFSVGPALLCFAPLLSVFSALVFLFYCRFEAWMKLVCFCFLCRRGFLPPCGCCCFIYSSLRFVSHHPSLSTLALLCRFTTVSFFSGEIRGSVGSSLITLPFPVLFSLSKSDLCVSSRRLCSLLWSSQFVCFFCAKIKRSLLSAVCCLHSESFSSGSSPHAARLTARVKQTDPPRIANVLRGNLLNYAHCGGEDVHNSGIKLLKVMQYLAPRLPAVYR